MEPMNERSCIVTREAGDPEGLIRFVVAPDGTLVADLKRNLPGRGCWVTADRRHLELAVKRRLFARALKREVAVPADLADRIDALLAKSALGALGLARKAGAVALGATKVEGEVRSGRAAAVLHADEASDDGVRKITQARRAVVMAEGPAIPAYKLFTEPEMGLALGAVNVIHAAVLGQEAGKAAVKRLVALDRYRGGTPDERLVVAPVFATKTDVFREDDAAEDME